MSEPSEPLSVPLPEQRRALAHLRSLWVAYAVLAAFVGLGLGARSWVEHTIAGARGARLSAVMEQTVRMVTAHLQQRVDLVYNLHGLLEVAAPEDAAAFRQLMDRIELSGRYPELSAVLYLRRGREPLTHGRAPSLPLFPGGDGWLASALEAASQQTRPLLRARMTPGMPGSAELWVLMEVVTADAPTGAVIGVFRGDQVLEDLRPLEAVVDYDLYASDPPTAEALLYRSFGATQKPQPTGAESNSSVRTLSVGGARWTLVFSPRAGFEELGVESTTPNAAAVVGALVGLLLFGVIATQVRARVAAERLTAELRRSEEQLLRSYQQLAQTQEELVRKERLAAVGELAAVMAHEVRNPLGVVFNALESLRRAWSPPPEAKGLLRMLGEEADRINRIVEDLLHFARPLPPHRRMEAVEPLISSAVGAACCTPELANRAEVRIEVPPQLAPVPVDARMIRQVLVNLIVNAMQAVAAGGLVRVRGQDEQRQGRSFLRVDVVDDGPGIDPRVSSRLFQPFVTTKASGTGLGLAVVRRFVDAHGGEVLVESSSEGTMFTLLLPRDLAIQTGPSELPTSPNLS